MSQVKQYINGEWTSVLIGKQGPQGIQGIQGPIGYTGSAGTGGATINDSSNTSTTETWSANKLYTTFGNIDAALQAIQGV